MIRSNNQSRATESEIIAFGRKIEIRRYSRSRFVGSDCFQSLETRLTTMIERGDPLFAVIRITRKSDLEECSMFWIMLTLFPQMSNFRIKKLCCMCLKNEAVIKIIKGTCPTMRHVSRTHRVALDWLFDRINSDPKIQIKCIDTKNQLADMLTKGNFTRDEWNHLLCLFNTGHFSSTDCSEVTSKRTQEESSEQRVTAKSRPMIRLIARAPSALSYSA